MLHEAFCVLSGWDFEYKTLLVWEKTGRLGMGYWFRVQTELLLVATRGKPKPFRKQFKNIIRAPVGRHSEKPACFRQLIMDCSPGPYLELFARAAEPGWTAVGLDVGTEVRQWLDEASANP
jgi:N6-adenosine-specific RNA methylase IME4